MVRASGLAEVWTHSTEAAKFDQFGWRCTNKETSYSNDTLIGNWNEQRFDIEKAKIPQRLPGQHEHYFETSYGVGYNKVPYEVPKELQQLKGRHSHAFPGHQPELDSMKLKQTYNSWETTTRAGYVDPRIRKEPVQNPV
ncbi:hypothetical protein FSP39_023326 [Pinctada imbricata]|uniref:Uncharacterized protein n=1 Tax=Pinctada imbricata TaxID=66713 RepID=A0AA88YG81_PINIB|nr:hypothetical protein FSP39_023326 [Pinctada imbricata]